MVFETPRPDKELKLTDSLSVPLPQFDEGVKFQQAYVRVWVPKQYRLVGDPDGFVSHIGVGVWDSRAITEAADNPDGWFPKDSSSFDFQVGGTTYLFSSLANHAELNVGYWHIPTMTTIGILAALQIAFIAAVESSSGQETRTMSAPASSMPRIWSIVALASAVTVLVIVWTLIGASPPIATEPT